MTLNFVYGTSGDDALAGSPGDDRMWGYEGNDTLTGNDGDDWLRGNKGDDFLFGDNGNDLLLGGQGNDVLNGGSGDDILDGNGGVDQFFFNRDWGTDFIRDFDKSAGEKLNFNVTTFGYELIDVYETDNGTGNVNTTLVFSEGGSEDRIILKNFEMDDLDMSMMQVNTGAIDWNGFV